MANRPEIKIKSLSLKCDAECHKTIFPRKRDILWCNKNNILTIHNSLNSKVRVIYVLGRCSCKSHLLGIGIIFSAGRVYSAVSILAHRYWK